MTYRRRLASCAIACAVLLLTGCASFTGEISPNVVATSAAQYRAYGDSITYGLTLVDPETQAYPYLVAVHQGVTVANNAIVETQACDVARVEIFPNQDSPTLATHPTYTLLIGTNDADYKGAGPYEAVFRLCHQAAISWLAIPAEYKVLSGSPGMTTTGPGAIDTTNNWNSWTTGGQGATVSFTIETVSPGPIYAWPRISDNNPATYSYSLDDVVVGNASVEVTPSISTAIGGSDSLGFLRLPSVPAGTHVVKFMQTSVGMNGVSVVGIGTPTGPSSNTLPTVLAGTITYQNHDTAGKPCTPSSYQPCQEYTEDIEDDVALLEGDGLNVRLFDTGRYMLATDSEMNDGLHPNVLGQGKLSESVEAVWRTGATQEYLRVNGIECFYCDY